MMDETYFREVGMGTKLVVLSKTRVEKREKTWLERKKTVGE